MLDLNKIIAACEAATPGPWLADKDEKGYEVVLRPTNKFYAGPDCDFIDRARTWLPALVAELREARTTIGCLRQSLAVEIQLVEEALAELREARAKRAEIGRAFDWLWGFWDGNTLVAASAADREEIQKAFEQLGGAIQ